MRLCSWAFASLLSATGAAIAAQSNTAPPPSSDSPAGPAANTCGVPANTPPPTGRGATPVFPPGQYPVSLPAVSLLGARNDLPNPYQAGVDWGQLPAGRKWGSTASVTTAADGTIWVVDRCGNSGAGGTTCGGASANVNPIFQFEPSGKLLKSMGAGMFVSPHKLTLDDAGNLWLADNGSHQIFKMTQDGRVLLTLGKKGVAGPGPDEFDAPTEVAVAPNGDIFVADGHTGGGTAVGNARIVKFDKTGKFIKTWGKKGMGPGEFDVPHTLVFDSRGRLFVGDRQNNRIQIFDQDGKFIAQWFQFGRPSGMYIDKKTDTLYVADSESRDGRTNTGQQTLPQTGYGFNAGIRRGIRIGSVRDGSVKYLIPDPCPYPYAAGSSLAEGVTVDAQGDVYGADFLTDVRKFVLKRGSSGSAASNAPRNDLPQRYRTTRDWGELPPGVKWAAVTAVEAADDGSIYVIHRCFDNSCAGRSEAPILKYDKKGKLLKSWGERMFNFPHGATVDRDGNLWVTDARGGDGKGHQVFKFDPNGKVLMTLGKAGVSGSGPDLFDQPTDVVIAPNGDIFVTDSHRNGKNNRVVKFDRNGKFIKEWGKKGSGPGEISEPHTIAMDSRGRVFVGDRENNRIQIFDQNGTFIAQWTQFGRPSGIFIAKDDTMYVTDSESGPDSGAHELPGIKKGIRIGSARDGSVKSFIEDSESTAPDHSGAEGLGVDADGNVYGAVVRRQMLERHVKK